MGVATAQEDGSENGRFRFIRTGDLTASLTVNFTLDGSSTATSGTDYVSIGTSVTLGAGEWFADKTVTIIRTPSSNRPRAST